MAPDLTARLPTLEELHELMREEALGQTTFAIRGPSPMEHLYRSGHLQNLRSLFYGTGTNRPNGLLSEGGYPPRRTRSAVHVPVAAGAEKLSRRARRRNRASHRSVPNP